MSEKGVMNSKSKIKVIKKAEAVPAKKPAIATAENPKTQVRRMVGNVTAWVSELQQRKSEEAKVAFEQLFGSRPQTSGV